MRNPIVELTDEEKGLILGLKKLLSKLEGVPQEDPGERLMQHSASGRSCEILQARPELRQNPLPEAVPTSQDIPLDCFPDEDLILLAEKYGVEGEPFDRERVLSQLKAIDAK